MFINYISLVAVLDTKLFHEPIRTQLNSLLNAVHSFIDKGIGLFGSPIIAELLIVALSTHVGLICLCRWFMYMTYHTVYPRAEREADKRAERM